jgi:hypothetical protein
MPAFVVRREMIEKLGLDLAVEVKAFQAALKAHAKTVNVAAPVADPLVEVIVRQYDGEFVIEDPPEATTPMVGLEVEKLIDALVEEGVIPEGKADRIRDRLKPSEPEKSNE